MKNRSLKRIDKLWQHLEDALRAANKEDARRSLIMFASQAGSLSDFLTLKAQDKLREILVSLRKFSSQEKVHPMTVKKINRDWHLFHNIVQSSNQPQVQKIRTRIVSTFVNKDKVSSSAVKAMIKAKLNHDIKTSMFEMGRY